MTIKDVAKVAGVSVGTVSKVINGSAEISDETCERVLNVVRELGYIPNKSAQELKRKTFKSIVFLAKFNKDEAFNNPHLFEIMLGAYSYFDIKGYTFSILNENGCDYERVEQLIKGGTYNGVLAHASVSKKLLRFVEKSGVPMVVIGKQSGNEFCSVDNDNVLCGAMAAKHLHEIGRKHIAYIGGEKYDEISEARFLGADNYLQSINIPIEHTLHLRGESTQTDGAYMIKRALKQHPDMDAIICANNAIAFGVMQYLKEKHISVPQQIAVISFDKYPYSSITDPALTVVDIDVYDLGIKSAKLLVDKMRDNSLCCTMTTTLPRIIIRESTVQK